MEVPIHLLSVFVSAVAVIVVSFVWYGPLFGKIWMKSVGMDKLSPEEMEKGKKDMPKNSLVQFVFALMMAYVLTYVTTYAGAYNDASGIMLGIESGFWTWFGFVAPVSIGMVLWEGRPLKYWFIVAGNWLVNLVVIGAIIAAFM